MTAPDSIYIPVFVHAHNQVHKDCLAEPQDNNVVRSPVESRCNCTGHVLEHRETQRALKLIEADFSDAFDPSFYLSLLNTVCHNKPFSCSFGSNQVPRKKRFTPLFTNGIDVGDGFRNGDGQ